jgi:hypothetical protein
MFICKLYYLEEYETPIGRDSVAGWQYNYEQVKNYFYEKRFQTELEANDYGQEQMYLDNDCDYDIVEEK